MLLTCNVSSIADLLKPRGKQPPRLNLADLPAYVKNELGLHGMHLTTDLLTGSTPERLSSLRDQADKAGCACLGLIENEAQPFGSPDEAKAAAAADRTARVIKAAQLLGCSSAAIRVEAKDDDDTLDLVANRVRKVIQQADRLEINLLFVPMKGLTENADRLTELIKKIGGFRIGTLPEFGAAHESGDAETYLRRITPYAGTVMASTFEFGESEGSPDLDDDKPGSLEDLADALMSLEAPPHLTYDLEPMIGAVNSVGFDGTLAIHYRGGGDSTLGVIQSRDAIEAAIESLEG